MKIVSLRVNGNDIDGLDNATVKITLNNISPVTMTGDSVAFSATVKVPRTPNNDRTFIGLNKGLLNCEYYVAEVLIASIPFKYYAYVSDEPTQFYAKVSASQTEYTVNLIESTDKWSDVSKQISSPYVHAVVRDIENSQYLVAVNLSQIVRTNFNFPQMTFPNIQPYYADGTRPVDYDLLQAHLICSRGDLSWNSDVAAGSTSLIPRNSTKGRGGYVYPGAAQYVFDNASMYLNASYFGTAPGGLLAGLKVKPSQEERFATFLIEYTGDSIPATKPDINLVGNSSGERFNFFAGVYKGQVSERVWVYSMKFDSAAGGNLFPKADSHLLISATINGATRTDFFKIPNGYSPGECVRFKGEAKPENDLSPTVKTVNDVPIGFSYTDVKNIVDDMCTAWHWRKIYRNGTLRVEPIVDADLRDGTSTAWAHIHDWSNKLLSVETVDVPDEFADQYICTLDSTQFSYNNGAGTVTPVKEAYKSAIKFPYSKYLFPKVGLTAAFSKTGYDQQYIHVNDIYYPYINRHFKMFKSRIQVKIKAQLEYTDVENLRLGDAYYFSQLNSCFYIKSLGEYDVATGNCKLSLYKMDLK